MGDLQEWRLRRAEGGIDVELAVERGYLMLFEVERKAVDWRRKKCGCGMFDVDSVVVVEGLEMKEVEGKDRYLILVMSL